MAGPTNKGSSSTQPNLTPGETALYNQTGQNVQNLQNLAPVSDFLNPNPTKVAPLSGTQQGSVDLMNQSLSDVMSGKAQQGILTPSAQYQNLLNSANTPATASPLLAQTQRYAGLLGSTGGPLEQSPIVQAGTRYFQSAIAPGITNQATLSGLGRSTANTNALSAAQGQVMLPLLQGEQARQQALITGEQGRQDTIQQQQQQRNDQLITQGQGRTDTLATQQQARMDQLVNQGMAVGDAQRQVQQEANNAEAVDAQRRQALSEKALFGPLNQLPSTWGTNVQQGGTQSGMFGTAISTYFHSLGWIDDDTYHADEAYGASLPYEIVDGYQRWAVPLVMMMKRSRLLTILIAPFAILWAREMKARMDGKPREGSWVGAFMLRAGIPICSWLGTYDDDSLLRIEYPTRANFH